MTIAESTPGRLLRLFTRRIAVPVVALLAFAVVLVASTGRPASAAATAGSRPRAAASQPLVRLMPLGDSITWGAGSPTFDGYRVDLAQRLAATGLRVDFVGSRRDGVGPDTDHEGHSHWTIQDIAAHVDAWLAIYQPDVILLNIGTNNTQTAAAAESAPAALSGLIDQLEADRPTADIFVTKITSAKNPERQPVIDAYNAVVPDIVAGKGPRVHLVDQSTVGGPDLRDNIHPNAVGYAKMSYNWYNALQPVLGPLAARWPAGANPYAATTAYLCAAVNPYVYVGPSDCRWWYLRDLVSTVAGVQTDTQVWQTVRKIARAHRVIVRGYHRMVVVGGKRSRVWVPTHTATRYAQVSVWASE